MKTIIIDWDQPPAFTLIDIFQKKEFTKYNIVFISSLQNFDHIKNKLKEVYPEFDLTKSKVKIMTGNTLLTLDQKKALGINKIDLISESFPKNQFSNLLFISGNLHARAEVKKKNIAVSSKIPILSIPKEASHPSRQVLKNFPLDKLTPFFSTSGNSFVSKTNIIQKNGLIQSSRWFAKEKDKKKLIQVQMEVFVSEILRFYLGNNLPKSRYIVDNDYIYVLSKAITDFKNFNSPEALDRLAKNNFKGLLPLLFICMFLEEADLKRDNFGVDEEGNVVKIDNDGALASIIFSMKDNTVPAELRKNLIDQFSFSIEDIISPHQPTYFGAPVWETDFFITENVSTLKNTNELYNIWAKLVMTENIFFKILDKIIESHEMRLIIQNLFELKFKKLFLLIKNNPGFNEYISNNNEKMMEKIKNEVSIFVENEKYFTPEDQNDLKIKDVCERNLVSKNKQL